MTDDTTSTDVPAIGGSPDGAERRLEELVRQYAALVRSAIIKTGAGHGAQNADEIEQRVWLAIWKQLRREQEIHHPTSYIYRAAVRETVRYLRSERRVEEKAVAQAANDPPGEVGPERLAESSELGRQIRDAMNELNPLRKLAVQAHLMGYSVQEIMSMHGWTYQKARNLIARGTTDLRDRLRSRGVS